MCDSTAGREKDGVYKTLHIVCIEILNMSRSSPAFANYIF